MTRPPRRATRAASASKRWGSGRWLIRKADSTASALSAPKGRWTASAAVVATPGAICRASSSMARRQVDGDGGGAHHQQLGGESARAGTHIHHPPAGQIDRDRPEEGAGEPAIDVIEPRSPELGRSPIVGGHRRQRPVACRASRPERADMPGGRCIPNAVVTFGFGWRRPSRPARTPATALHTTPGRSGSAPRPTAAHGPGGRHVGYPAPPSTA